MDTISFNTQVFTESTLQLLRSVYNKNQIFNGELTELFTNKFREYHCGKYAVAFNSSEDAFRIALSTMKIRHLWNDGDEIIIPTIAPAYIINSIMQHNLTPVFCDVDYNTYNINYNLIEHLVTNKTKCIVPISNFGILCDIEAIYNIAYTHNIKVIHDSSQCNGYLVCEDKNIPEFAHISIFNLVNSIAIVNDDEYKKIMTNIMNIEKNQYINYIGYDIKVSESQSAIGLSLLEILDNAIIKRQGNLNEINLFIIKQGLPLETNNCISTDNNSYELLPLIILDNTKKEDLMQFLNKHGIETINMHPITNQPIYKHLFGNKIERQYKVAQNINEKGFCIPCHEYLLPKEIDYIKKTILSFYSK